MGATPEGDYANYVEIGFTASEWLFDFGQIDPYTEAVLFHTRIITTPVFAKVFLGMLADAVERYEKTVKVIETSD